MVWWCGKHNRHSIDDTCSDCDAEYRLKAVAPELLEALQRIHAEIRLTKSGMREVARAAIAKATGGHGV